MKVALFDLDINKYTLRKFPNLALMKLSAYHKKCGDRIYFNSLLEIPDRVYASAVFTWNRKINYSLPEDTIYGGPAWIATPMLSTEAEHILPDYDLYPYIDFSMGFTSRGCIRHCPWCKVPDLEGDICYWADFKEFWDRRHKRLLLLDNNLLASPHCLDTLKGLATIPAEIDFNQGLDIRLLDDEKTNLLKKLNNKKLRFAFDSLSYEDSIRSGIALLVKAGFKTRHLHFYVLIGFPGDETWLERMKILASLNVNVYPMIYRGDDGKEGKVNRQIVPDVFWHGARNNINKFLSVAGRLPGRPN